MNKTMNNEILREWIRRNKKKFLRPRNRNVLLCHEFLYLLTNCADRKTTVIYLYHL